MTTRHAGARKPSRRSTLAAAAVLSTSAVLSPRVAFAQNNTAHAGKPEQLQTIVVTATRIPEPAFDVPASISGVRIGGPGQDEQGVNAAEYLRSVPGVLVRNRQAYAEGDQISIRGFGARATFGVRGVRLYVDGIPATMPDGQGDVSNFDFGGADRIEVLRGPFSALYGNSSGGVIQIFTADGSTPPELLAGIGAGSHGLWRADFGARGTHGGFGYNLDLSHFRTDGFRQHSRAERTNGNAKFDFKIGRGGKLTVLLNTVATPAAQDPEGLTRAQYVVDPRQAAPSALRFDTRKSVHQAQGGAVYTQQLDDHQQFRALVYYGQRRVQQFLAVPVAAQKNPLSAGGVIDLDGKYGGTDLRWTWQGELAGHALDFTAGIAYDREDVYRLGYNNFVGDALGVAGALRRGEQDDVYDVDQYAQGTWKFAPRWSLTLGARHSVVRFSSLDHFISVRNPDGSGRVAYGSTAPVAGLMFYASDRWHLYASYGNGFETPTSDELAYGANGEGGLNFALHPARSRNGEIGSKWLFGNGGELDLALFQSDTRDQIAVLGSVGGRTTYHNVGRARRRGAEVALELPLAPNWRLHVAYTLLGAHYRDAFNDCGEPSCEIEAGTRIPGTPRQFLDAALRWGGDVGWHAEMNVNAVSAVSANDANTQIAPGYAVVDLHAGYVFDYARCEFAPFVRVDNALDRRYIGAVVVNQANGGSFEPAPGRTYWVGLNVRLRQ